MTILLVGKETKDRKHIDWEIYSSMYDGKVNKKSGILVINLPSIAYASRIVVDHGEQKFYPDINNWTTFKKENHPMPYM